MSRPSEQMRLPGGTEAALVVFRQARLEDAPALASLSGQLGYPSSPEEMRARLQAILGREEHVVFVAEQGGQVVAWIHVFLLRLVEANPEAEIGGLIVDEQCRGRGIGWALVHLAEEWARSLGCASISVRSNVVRERTHGFYESLGYARVKAQHTFRKPLPREQP